ncbi:hypothetical protein SSBR45G_20320 [Bradyrhizobium sp. SSBR45G]|nr:hypothetical protein SSBR45G_20320 [Bradyrhizobium sp. SSBR45G]GLH83882.1 hypothetical protein SSBR45R_13420 [Bradyrhizobium sp. SSBR45R]
MGIALAFSGCGLRTPEVVLGSDPNAASFFVNAVVNHVRCELRYAIRYAVWYDTENARIQRDHLRRIPWIEKWGAKLALKLLVKENGSVNPTVSLISPLPLDQSYTTVLGGSASSQATRTVNLEFYFDFASEFLGADFDRRQPPEKCVPLGTFQIEGDLKIAQFIDMATFPFFLPGNISAKKPEATSQEIEFVTSVDGNISPTWKLIRVGAGGSSPGMLDGARSNTNDIIVSIGPTFGGEPSEELDKTHFLARQQSNLFSSSRR